MIRRELTEKQRTILTEIARYREANGEDCSVSYLARRLGVHWMTMKGHLQALHEKGWLRTPNPGSAPAPPSSQDAFSLEDIPEASEN